MSPPLLDRRRRRGETANPWTRPTTPRAGVVGPPGLASAFGAALGLRLAGASGDPVVLLASVRPADGPRASATAAASRAADALEARNIVARPSGRLVRAALGERAPEVDLEHAAAVVTGPAVIAVGEARTLSLDSALGGCDLLVLVSDPESPPLAAGVAEASLAALGPPVRRVELRPGLLARSLALSGLAAVEPLRSAADGAIEALR